MMGPAPDRVNIEVMLDGRGLPCGAAAVARVEATPARVYGIFRQIERYPGRVPMIHRAARHGGQATIELRFKVALLSARFEFTVDVIETADALEMRWVSGEPRGLRIRHEVAPLDGGAAALVRTHIEFDLYSLGWLVKFFLRHHPEIQFGVFSGSALAMLHALRAAAQAPAP